MSVAAISLDAAESGTASHIAALKMVEAWAQAVDLFRQWQREEILAKEPSPEQVAEHRRALTWMLRWTRILQTLVVDPEFPARECAAEVAGRLLQLEQSWVSVHDPMTDPEADAILQTAFPDAPGTRKPR